MGIKASWCNFMHKRWHNALHPMVLNHTKSLYEKVEEVEYINCEKCGCSWSDGELVGGRK